MTLPMNDDFANCELSIEELEAIAAGGFWSTFKHIVGDVIKGAEYTLWGATIVAGVALGIGGAVYTIKGVATNQN